MCDFLSDKFIHRMIISVLGLFAFVGIPIIMLTQDHIPKDSPKSNRTTPNITVNTPPPSYNQTSLQHQLDREFNISTWDLPSSPSDCVQMAMNTGNYPTFIDKEYRCHEGNYSCNDSGNVIECRSFFLNPGEYLRRYFNKTVRRPKSEAACSSRDSVRWMDFTNESWYSTIPKEKQGHKMFQCKLHFKMKMSQYQPTTTPATQSTSNGPNPFLITFL